MILHISQVLNAAQVGDMTRALSNAGWTDGRITAGHQSSRAKDNLQLPESDPIAREQSAAVCAALDRNALFFASTLPRRIFPPLFNRYRTGHGFGNHVDNAVRTDLSATLFLSAPESYDGGELVIGGGSGVQRVKLPAGDLLLYPATSVH